MKEKSSEGRKTSRDQDPAAFEIVAKTIKRVRKASGKSQGELSRELDKDRTYIGRIERHLQAPDVPTFLRILKLCGVDASEVVGKMVEQIEKEAAKRSGKS